MQSIASGNFEVSVLKHSVGPSWLEAVTFRWTYERFIHAEVMTHRWSRNYSSSRAIPYPRMMEWIASDPALPLHVGSNRAGMQSGGEVEDADSLRLELRARFADARDWCDGLAKTYNPHKETINRYTEPWGWISGVATMGRCQLMNFFALRCTPEAHANIQRLAINSLRLYRVSVPQRLSAGQWHTPFFDDYIAEGPAHSQSVGTALVWSAARCAWASYNSPAKDATYERALIRHDHCVKYKHMTPLEHQLRARPDRGRLGVVPGFDSYRMLTPGESAYEVDMDAILERYGDRDYLIPE